MLFRILLLAIFCCPMAETVSAAPPAVHAVLHTYEARIRLNGVVSTTRVQAKDGGHAKKLVEAQFGSSVTVLSVKRVD